MITAYTFVSTEFDVQWQAPYVSQSLNRAIGTHAVPGIYRGFKLGTSTTAMHVSVNPDPTYEDHAAVYRDANGNAIVVRREVEEFDVDLTAYASDVAVVAIYCTYATSATTTAVIQVMTLAEYNASANKAQLVVMGTVNAPASGAIPAADITDLGRTEAWSNASNGMIVPVNLVKNGSFENSDVGKFGFYAFAWWENVSGVGTPFKVAAGDPGDPSDPSDVKCAALHYDGSTTIDVTLLQQCRVRLRDTDSVRVRFQYNVLQVCSTIISAAYLQFTDANGLSLGVGPNVQIPVGSATSGYVQVDQVVPVSDGAVFLDAILLVFDGLTGAGAGDVVHIDNVEVWVDTRLSSDLLRREDVRQMVTNGLVLSEQGIAALSTTFDSPRALLWLDVSGDTVPEPRVVLDLQSQAYGASPALAPFFELLNRMRVGHQTHQVNRLAEGVWHEYLGTQATIVPLTLLEKCTPSVVFAPGTASVVRTYVDVNGNLIRTMNAAAQTGTPVTWAKDQTGVMALKITEGPTVGVLVQVRLAANDAGWADSAWDEVTFSSIPGAGSILLAGPASATFPATTFPKSIGIEPFFLTSSWSQELGLDNVPYLVGGAGAYSIALKLPSFKNGSTLASVTMWIAVAGTHAGGVAGGWVAPSIDVNRIALQPGGLVGVSLKSTGPVSPAPASGSAWYDGGNLQGWTFTTDQNNVIDNSNYAYIVTLIDENSTNSEAGNLYRGMTAIESAVTNLGMQT